MTTDFHTRFIKHFKMTVEKALNHLAKKIGTNQYSTAFDKECINTLIDYFTETNKTPTQNSYYKLYLWTLNYFINLYDKSEEKSQVRVHKILELPVQFHIDQITSSLNAKQLYEDLAIEEDGNDLPKHSQERLEAFFNSTLWTREEVIENTLKSANLALLRYDN